MNKFNFSYNYLYVVSQLTKSKSLDFHKAIELTDRVFSITSRAEQMDTWKRLSHLSPKMLITARWYQLLILSSPKSSVKAPDKMTKTLKRQLSASMHLAKIRQRFHQPFNIVSKEILNTSDQRVSREANIHEIENRLKIIAMGIHHPHKKFQKAQESIIFDSQNTFVNKP